MKEVNQGFLEKCREEYKAQLYRCNNPGEVVENVFFDILDQMENTVFYHDHNLKGISSVGEFTQKVPIRSYQEFDQYIDMIMRGAQNVLSKSRCFAFYKTSGTSGKSKYIPSTYHWRQEYRGPALYAQWGLYFKLIGAKSLSADNVLDISWARAKTETKIGLPLYSITNRPSALDGNDWNPPWHDAPWFYCDKKIDHTKTLIKLLVDTACNEVKVIVAVNPSKIVALYEALNSSKDEILPLLMEKRQRVSRTEESEKIDRLIERIRSNEHLTLMDVWPDLSLMVCWRSASAGKYVQWLNRAAPNVAVVPFSTVGTEGIVTIPVDASPSGGALSINQGLYEFVDVSELADSTGALPPFQKTRQYNELEVGKRYRLIMTQANGIYRYDTQDVYEVVGWVGKTPRIDFVGRSNVGSSFTGEKLTEDNIYQAVKKTLKNYCSTLPFFTCVPVWGNPPHYKIAIEMHDACLSEKIPELRESLEQNLYEINEEYEEKRRTHRLGEMQLVLLKQNAFSDINRINVNRGISAAQVKHLWIQGNDKILETLRECELVVDESLINVVENSAETR
jgi:hypothetical protein